MVIAGSGPAYLPLAARISAARAPVTLLGHRTDVADLLAGADLAVVTSDWEARQLFAQEALRAGVPLVATAVGGLPELVGDAAVLVPPGDVDARRRGRTRAARRPRPPGRAGAARRRSRRPAGPTEADTVAALAGPLRRAGTGRTGRGRHRRLRRRRSGGDGPGMMLRRGVHALLTMLVVAVGVTALVGPPRRTPSSDRSADYVVSPGSPGCAGRTSTRRPPRRCGGWPARARSARWRCARRTGPPARSTAG